MLTKWALSKAEGRSSSSAVSQWNGLQGRRPLFQRSGLHGPLCRSPRPKAGLPLSNRGFGELKNQILNLKQDKLQGKLQYKLIILILHVLRTAIFIR